MAKYLVNIQFDAEAEFEVEAGNNLLAELEAEKRFYEKFLGSISSITINSTESYKKPGGAE